MGNTREIKIMDFNLNFNDYESGDIPFRKESITCQVCGEYSRYHCRERIDGKLAICRNTPNDRPTKDGNGYIYDLPFGSDKQTNKVAMATEKRIDTVAKADANRLDEVYRTYCVCSVACCIQDLCL